MLCLLKQSCINLEVMLILWSNFVWFFFWHHQNHVHIHSHSLPFWWWQTCDFFSTPWKLAWFTFSPFLKKILLDIIKIFMIYRNLSLPKTFTPAPPLQVAPHCIWTIMTAPNNCTHVAWWHLFYCTI